MDQTRFDTLTTRVGMQRTRRAAIGVAIAAILGTAATDETRGKARCLKAGTTCSSAKKKKKKKRTLEEVTASKATAAKCCSGTTCLTSSGMKPKAGKKGTCRCTGGKANCNGTCTPLDEIAVCPINEFPRCLNRDDCLCTRTVEGKAYCARSTSCDTPCTSSSQCPSGSACVATCCGAPGEASPHCLPSCGKI